MSQSRNEPCACGSGKKFKNCCNSKTESSFLKKHGSKLIGIVLILFISYVSWDMYNRWQVSGPENDYDIYCIQCDKWYSGDNPDTPIDEQKNGGKHVIFCEHCEKVVQDSREHSHQKNK